jgi:hypothetical protein
VADALMEQLEREDRECTKLKHEIEELLANFKVVGNGKTKRVAAESPLRSELV